MEAMKCSSVKAAKREAKIETIKGYGNPFVVTL